MIGQITPASVANSIRMLRSVEPGACFCIVEGPTDKTFFKRFLDEIFDRIQIVPANGRPDVERALSILQNDKDRARDVFAIVDADFDHLKNLSVSNRSLLRTDTHDVETMCLATVAFSKILGEYVSENKLASIGPENEVLARLLNAASPIAYLRWHSLENGLSLKFEGLKFSKFVDIDAIAVEKERLFAEVRNHSRLFNIADETMQKGMEELRNDAHDPLQLCCGHDVIEILAVCLRRIGRGHDLSNPSSTALERSLRLAYEKADFDKTILSMSLKAWYEEWVAEAVQTA